MHIYLCMSKISSTFAPAFRQKTPEGMGMGGARYLSSGGRAMD